MGCFGINCNPAMHHSMVTQDLSKTTELLVPAIPLEYPQDGLDVFPGACDNIKKKVSVRRSTTALQETRFA